MSYLFIAAAFDYGARKGPVKAFCCHMAEGGGTVGFLARNPTRGVSVHYVVEYSGRIVQMLREDRASGSINPQTLRSTEGPVPFGAKVRKAVMGQWDSDPNSAVITVELEGFAVTGPNPAQAAALVTLVRDVRSRYPLMGLLGHRDFTGTKACPGSHIAWAALGGHGPAASVPKETPDMLRSFTFGPDIQVGSIVVDTPSHAYLRLSDGTLHPAPVGWAKATAFGPVRLTLPITGGAPGADRSTGFVVGDEAAFLLANDCKFTPKPAAAAVTHKVELQVDGVPAFSKTL
jgi:hypothetical protein